MRQAGSKFAAACEGILRGDDEGGVVIGVFRELGDGDEIDAVMVGIA